MAVEERVKAALEETSLNEEPPFRDLGKDGSSKGHGPAVRQAW